MKQKKDYKFQLHSEMLHMVELFVFPEVSERSMLATGAADVGSSAARPRTQNSTEYQQAKVSCNYGVRVARNPIVTLLSRIIIRKEIFPEKKYIPHRQE